jgi:hypothetical protein
MGGTPPRNPNEIPEDRRDLSLNFTLPKIIYSGQ